MALITISKITKKYKLDKNKYFTALKNINLSFPSSGLIAIKGASGSGKSTLINLLADFDKPSEGKINIDGIKNLSKEKNVCYYRNKVIGFLFQEYNLLNDETVIYNVALPCLISGDNIKSAFDDAKTLLEKVGIKKNLFNKKVSLLSGGERQRVALCRSLINSPNILLCDEPTGALDSDSSKNVMNILKKISESKLVLLVSHNDSLINEYADRIITLKNGEVISDIYRKNEDLGQIISKKQKLKKEKYVTHFTIKNMKKRWKRILFSSFSFSLSLIFSLLVIGFVFGYKNSINEASNKQFDIASSLIYKQVSNKVPGSSLSLNKIYKLDESEINDFINTHDEMLVFDNYSYFVPERMSVNYSNSLYEDINYSPIYSFYSGSVDSSLLIKGVYPSGDNIKEVLINKSLFERLAKDDNPLYSYIDISNKGETSYFDINGNEIKDYFNIEIKSRIVGVVDDLDFLSTPKIYYSYVGLMDYLYDYKLENLSKYLNKDVNILDRVSLVNNDKESTYSHRVFLKDYSNTSIIQSLKNNNEQYVIDNQGITKYETLLDLSNVISMALTVFLIVCLLGSVLINGMISFASFSDDFKVNAILQGLGARKDDIASIYLNENLFISLLSFFISFALSIIIQSPLNYLINVFTGFKNIIDIPIYSFYNVNYLFPLIFLLVVILISCVLTYIPISSSRKRSISKELSQND